MSDGAEPISDDELLYRRAPKAWHFVFGMDANRTLVEKAELLDETASNVLSRKPLGLTPVTLKFPGLEV